MILNNSFKQAACACIKAFGYSWSFCRPLHSSHHQAMELPQTWCSRTQQCSWWGCHQTQIPSCIWALNTWVLSGPLPKVPYTGADKPTYYPNHQTHTFTKQQTFAYVYVLLEPSSTSPSTAIKWCAVGEAETTKCDKWSANSIEGDDTTVECEEGPTVEDCLKKIMVKQKRH